MPAEDLQPPQLKVRIPATGEVFDVDPGGRIAERLRGKDPRFSIDTPALRAAGLIPDELKGKEANAVADMLRHMGRNMDEKEEEGSVRRLHFNEDGQTSLKKLDAAVLDAHADSDTPVASLEVTSSGAESKTRSILGDVLNFIKNAWEKVRDFVITVGKGIAEMAIKIGEETYKLVISTARGIARAAQALFETIAKFFTKLGETAADLAKKLAKFTAALFGWDDIENTNEVFKFITYQTLDGMQKALDEDAVKWVDGKVGEMHNSIDSFFDEFEKVLGPLDPTNPQPALDADGSSRSSAIVGSMQTNGVMVKKVGNHMIRSPEAIALAGDTAAAKSMEKDDAITQFLSAIGKAYDEELKKGVLEVFKDFRPTNPAEFFQGGLIRALRTMKPMFKFAANLGGEIAKLALRALAKFIELIHALLKAPVYLGDMSQLYKLGTGKDMTVLDVLTLLVAIPFTLIYKLFNKLQVPFTAEDVKQLQQDKPMWGEMFSTIGKMLRAVRDPHKGVEVTKDMKAAAEKFIATWRKPAQWMALGKALTDFSYGIVMGAKHAVDSKEITGKAGTAVKVVAFLVQLIRFIIGLPALLLTLAGLLIKGGNLIVSDDGKKKEGPFTLPYLMSPLSVLFTIVGLGLMIVLAVTPLPTLPATIVVDMVEAAVFNLVALYSLVALIHNGIVTGDGWLASADALEQVTTMISMLPGFLSFIPPMVPTLDTVYAAGEVLLAILLVTDISTGYFSGATGTAGSIIRIASK